MQVFDLEDPRQNIEVIRRESALLGECSNPNVLRFFETVVVGTELWIVLEYAEGGSLQDYLVGSGLVEAQISAAMLGLVKGLAYLHENGIFHRDIKSGNSKWADVSTLSVLPSLLLLYAEKGPSGPHAYVWH